MSADDRDRLRDSHYLAYASTHAGIGDPLAEGAGLATRRDIIGRLGAPELGVVIDIGCGQGTLVRDIRDAGYTVIGVDTSPEQVAIAHRNGVPEVQLGDAAEVLARQSDLAAVTATDFFEHLTRGEVADLLRLIAAHLKHQGILVGRVPNAVSPFGGHYRHGDVTHETWYTARSLRQQLTVAGFNGIQFFACPPPVHTVKSAVRALLWRFFSGFYKASLIAETGVLRGHIVTQNLVFVAQVSKE